MDEDGNVINPDGGVETGKKVESQTVHGQVVKGRGEATSYVGATHCMAMLEDVSLYFMKSVEMKLTGADRRYQMLLRGLWFRRRGR